MMKAAKSNSEASPDNLSHSEEIFFLRHENKHLRDDVTYLEELVRHLKRQRFAPSSEIASSGQGTLFNEAEVIAKEDRKSESTSDKKDKKKKRGRPVRWTLSTRPMDEIS